MAENDYIIRKSIFEDKVAVNEAHMKSIREVCAKDYSSEQIKHWSSLTYTDDVWTISVNNDFHYVIEKNGKVEGFCHAKVHDDSIGEIVGLYFTYEVIGLDAGREVFELAMKYFKEKNPKKVIISATKTAKGFYEKMGFDALGPATDCQMRGTTIECFDMELIL